MNFKKAIIYVLGIIAFIIPIKLYFTPPSDYDGGPMMAYNFLFFYPLSILAFILSLVVIFRLKDFKGEVLNKTFLIASIIPTIILTTLIALNILRIANEPENYNMEIPNNEVALKINDSLKIELNGFTNIVIDDAGDYVNKKIINLLAYVNNKYKYKEGGKFTSISENQKLIYKVKQDSLIIYKQDYELSYFNDKRDGLPIRIEDIKTLQLNKKELEKMNFKIFVWK